MFKSYKNKPSKTKKILPLRYRNFPNLYNNVTAYRINNRNFKENKVISLSKLLYYPSNSCIYNDILKIILYLDVTQSISYIHKFNFLKLNKLKNFNEKIFHNFFNLFYNSLHLDRVHYKNYLNKTLYQDILNFLKCVYVYKKQNKKFNLIEFFNLSKYEVFNSFPEFNQCTFLDLFHDISISYKPVRTGFVQTTYLQDKHFFKEFNKLILKWEEKVYFYNYCFDNIPGKSNGLYIKYDKLPLLWEYLYYKHLTYNFSHERNIYLDQLSSGDIFNMIINFDRILKKLKAFLRIRLSYYRYFLKKKYPIIINPEECCLSNEFKLLPEEILVKVQKLIIKDSRKFKIKKYKNKRLKNI